MNDLERYFKENKGRIIDKWLHYFEVYDRHFHRFRNKPINILEVGVQNGGSLCMWKDYFGREANIYGLDLDERCKGLEKERIKIFIGDQADRRFLRDLKSRLPRLDVLIDDGGHTMDQQINTFEELFDHIKEDGVYLCEDLHTSYWHEYGGGYRKSKTFIEYSKDFVDYINAWHSREPERLSVNDFTRTVHSLHYYGSILVIEKRPIKEPRDEKTGMVSILGGEVKPRDFNIFRLNK